MNSKLLSTAAVCGLALVCCLFAPTRAQQPTDRLRETWKGPDPSLIRGILKGAGNPSRAAAPTRPAVLSFTPAGDSGVAKLLADAFGRTPEERAALAEAFAQIKQAYEAEVAREGKSHNLAAAMTFFISTNVAAYHGAELPSDEAGEQLFRSLQETMAGLPAFAALSNQEKQQLHDWLVCMAGFTLTGYTDARRSGDQESLKSFGELADYSLRLVLGVEAGKMNISSGGVSLGEEPGGSNRTAAAGVNATGITMATTRFEDGWVANIDADYVHLSKDGMDVYLFYPILFTDEIRSQDTATYFWNTVVVPRFDVKSATKIEDPIPDALERLYYVEGTGSDRRSGKSGFIAMKAVSISGASHVIVAVAPGKAAYNAAFPTPKDLTKMLNANRFALTASDLVGKWSDYDGTALGFYNANTGNYAGTSTAVTSDQFVFNPNGSYQSSHAGAVSQLGGPARVSQAKYNGRYSASNWEVSLTNRHQGQAETFTGYFEAVKGGRILHLTNKSATGIQYHLVLVK